MFCEKYKTVKEAKQNCECNCPKPQGVESTYYHCNYGNCCGFHCIKCGKFEVIIKSK